MTTKRGFWLAVALQVLILLGMVGWHSYTVLTGRPVTLQTAPVDPWDPMRGQYVRLSYVISQLQGDKIPFIGSPYKPEQTVWVTLQEGNPYWTAIQVSDQRPTVRSGQVALKARVQWFDEGKGNFPTQVFVRYGGIEQFYVPEGEGEKLQSRRDLSVEALVDSFGNVALHRVFAGDQEIKWH
ncbi:MAG: GDYXXLXY domain-containing protein [Mycobacterium leprae]